MVRIWDKPDRASSEPPGMDAYSVVLEIKIDGRRITGGIYELEEIRTGPYRGEGFGFYDFDPHDRLTPTALGSTTDVDRMTVSICVVRKRDKKCLHLATDISCYHADEGMVLFDDQEVGTSLFNHVDGNYAACDDATHQFQLNGTVWDEEGDFLRGFTDPHGELFLWDPEEPCAVPMEIVLRRWHASKNWV